jgi:hypothetical protein
MLVKTIVLIALALIIYCLGSGLFHLVREEDHGKKVVKALTWRISLSIALFLFLMLAFYMGWITPHHVGV